MMVKMELLKKDSGWRRSCIFFYSANSFCFVSLTLTHTTHNTQHTTHKKVELISGGDTDKKDFQETLILQHENWCDRLWTIWKVLDTVTAAAQ
jgi:hypothetical protein